MQKTAEQNYASLVTFYNTQLGNELGLFYNASEPTRDTCSRSEECLLIGPETSPLSGHIHLVTGVQRTWLPYEMLLLATLLQCLPHSNQQ